MKRVWVSAVMVMMMGILSLQAAQEKYTQEELREMGRQFEAFTQGQGTLPGMSLAVSFDTFQADRLDQQRTYGLGLDSFFGAMAMMEKAGQHSRSNPMPLLRKTLEGLRKNGFDRDSVKVIIFYFSRLGLKNPALTAAYKKEFQGSDRLGSSILASILWYAQDKEMQTLFRQIVKQETDPEQKQEYKEMFQNRNFAGIQAESMPIRECRDIEILWAEYFATGDMKAIERIVHQVTAKDEGLDEALISIEAGSSLAQRGGWFDEVGALCEAQQARAAGRDREIWEDITRRMKPLGNGMEIVKCPIERIALDGREGRAMACEAVFPKKSKGRLDVLGAFALDGGNVKHTRKILCNDWFDGGRFELITSMEGLAKGGHRARFDEDVRKIINLDETRRRLFISKQPLLEEPKWQIVCEYGPRLGSKSILAWDLSRVGMLGRFGYEAQYLSPLEVYRAAIPAAIRLQETFGSWEEFGENFWIGRWYWRAREEDRDAAKQAVEALLTEAQSPWKKYAWEMGMK